MDKKKNIIFGIVIGVAVLLLAVIMILLVIEFKNTPPQPYHGDSDDGTFSTSFIRASHEQAKGKNYMISPYSVEIALSMLREGTKGDSFEEINKVAPKRSIKTLSVQNRVNVANAIFIKTKFKNDVRDNYAKVLREEYGADFVYDAFETPDKINQWVDQETHGMIKKILNQMDPYFVLGLANAIAFEEDWQIPFECEGTYERQFTPVHGKKYKAAMMNHLYEEGASYYSDEDAEVVVLPYKMYDYKTGKEVEEDGEQLEFIAILPDDIDSYIKKLDLTKIKIIDEEKKLPADDTFDLFVSLPRFEFDYDFKEFKDTLIEMGIKSVFGTADLSVMLDNHSDAYINEAIHKTYVKVNEKGTKAAAVTYFGVKDNAAIAPDEKKHISVIFDKPFIFMIKDTKTNEIAFFGVVYDVEKWTGKACEE